MSDEARLSAWHRNVYESYDEPEPCDGCDERDAEIERLRVENDRLHDLIGALFRCTSTEQYDAAMAALSRETVRWLLAAATKEDDRG